MVIQIEHLASPVIPKNCAIWKTTADWWLNIRYLMQIHEFIKCTNIHALERGNISFPLCLRYLTSHVVLELLLFPFTNNNIATCRWIAWKTHTQAWKNLLVLAECSFCPSFCTDDRRNYVWVLVLQNIPCALCLVHCFRCWNSLRPFK